MAEYKKLIAGIGCKDGTAVPLFSETGREGVPFLTFALNCNQAGPDGLFILDLAESDEEKERHIGLIREAARHLDIPMIVGGRIRRLEDVKKYLYAGAKSVCLDSSAKNSEELLKEAAARFGKERLHMWIHDENQLKSGMELYQTEVSRIILDPEAARALKKDHVLNGSVPFFTIGLDALQSKDDIEKLLKDENSDGMILSAVENMSRYQEMKKQMANGEEEKIPLKIQISWDQLQTNKDGLVPVIVQDYKTSEVLMLAYMNEQAFLDTLHTGKMNYYSRSRQAQWLKGETSGHFQYVKALFLDCDHDTLLAKVHQIGAACHTGSKTCFYQTLFEQEYQEENPLTVFEQVFSLIQDRKLHPREGSYTNYLFDKGIDKILKKIGEEATEIVIAAKNPDPEEIKYEISDFLYHMMVLMAEKGVSWQDITEELANR